MAGISFCNCNWPQPDKWDSCDNCGDEMAQDRLDAINASLPACAISLGQIQIILWAQSVDLLVIRAYSAKSLMQICD